jgi:hypothetical protein
VVSIRGEQVESAGQILDIFESRVDSPVELVSEGHERWRGWL